MAPDDLMMEAFDLGPKEFTAKLKEARGNVVDAEGARILMETAVDYVDLVQDLDVLHQVVDTARPYFDRSFAELAGKLIKRNEDFIRQAGYQILGAAGDRSLRGALEAGLGDEDHQVVREVLIGLGRMGDPASRAGVERYLAKGSERLLAMGVLLRLGAADVLPEALAAYEEGLKRRIRLKSGRRAAHDTLYGGTAFKLTPKAREQAMKVYRRVIRLENEAKHDVRFFADSLQQLPESELDPVAAYLAGTEARELLPAAYAMMNRVSEDRAAAYRKQFGNAKLRELRLLAEE
jgi:hypothetical protein